MRTDKVMEAANPKATVDRILNDLLGKEFDLLSTSGRTAALEAIGNQPVEDSETAKPEALSAAVPEANKLSAWKAARSIAATMQIGAALTRLDSLAPLPDEGDDVLVGVVPEDFVTAKRQIGEQLRALRDEMSEDNDAEVIENIFQTLFAGERPLFDQLREAGNYVPGRVNDRNDEKQVIHYLAVRSFAAMLCTFGLDCKKPTKEPAGQSNFGEALNATEHAITCARDIGRKLFDELESMGVSSDCTMDTVPGLVFQGGSDSDAGDPESASAASRRGKTTPYKRKPDTPPTLREFFVLLKRVDDAADGWLITLSNDGKRGARLIRGEVDRLAAKAQRCRPKPPESDTDWPLIARLVDHFVDEIDRAASGIGHLLDT